jgi:hypothetical protein
MRGATGNEACLGHSNAATWDGITIQFVGEWGGRGDKHDRSCRLAFLFTFTFTFTLTITVTVTYNVTHTPTVTPTLTLTLTQTLTQTLT